MSRWLVTGAGGMLGTDMVDVLREAGEDVAATARRDLDVRDAEACHAAASGADVVVNCAAWTDVDGAEEHEAAAFAVNAVGGANLAAAAQAAGAVLVQVSTDYVFAGDASEPYPVNAPLAPINAYGRTKAAGEWAVRAECPRSYVVRTAWLYGEHGPNFVASMLRLARERETVEVVNDQVGQPTWTRHLAFFVRNLVSESKPFGTYHGTAEDHTTWYGLAKRIFAAAGLDSDRVQPTTSDYIRRPAARPAFSVLGEGNLPGWAVGLDHAFAQGAFEPISAPGSASSPEAPTPARRAKKNRDSPTVN